MKISEKAISEHLQEWISEVNLSQKEDFDFTGIQIVTEKNYRVPPGYSLCLHKLCSGVLCSIVLTHAFSYSKTAARRPAPRQTLSCCERIVIFWR